mgnify:CR=1 FL=1
MTALHELSLTGLVARLRDGTTTSVAIVEDCFRRIDAREATVGAWQHLDREAALIQAAQTALNLLRLMLKRGAAR